MMMKQCEASGMDTSKFTSLLNSPDVDENTSQQSGQDSGIETGRHCSSSDSSPGSRADDEKSHHSSSGETDLTPNDEKNDNYKKQDDNDEDPSPGNSTELGNIENEKLSSDTDKNNQNAGNDRNGSDDNKDTENSSPKEHSARFGKQTKNKHGFYTMKTIDWSNLRKNAEQASPDSSLERFCARLKASKDRTQKLLDAAEDSSISSNETSLSGASRSPPQTRSRAKKLLSTTDTQRTGAITGEGA